eukprot:CAMPEP_0172460444 /NCGR_PEP_ID=MMETSP1065-20121228/36917_1 /TAXON_ID=265537 /ORGANISM="Amphiprora paludosa, Strain CCMP125" /LENGTH=120 /DNA_ID=CAMNT_0013215465 /DNA_START=192 /DNA_END=554 /DNA_ORIENTATION=+
MNNKYSNDSSSPLSLQHLLAGMNDGSGMPPVPPPLSAAVFGDGTERRARRGLTRAELGQLIQECLDLVNEPLDDEEDAPMDAEEDEDSANNPASSQRTRRSNNSSHRSAQQHPGGAPPRD